MTTFDDTIPVPVSMNHLIALIKSELGSQGLDSDKVNVNRIVKLMENYSSNATDWSQYAHFDPYRYTRNLVDDGNGQFNLIVICWGPGHVSPIHDHANSHCCMKLLHGQLVETRYEFPSGHIPPDHIPGKTERQHSDGLHQLGCSTMEQNQVVYINDTIGLHRVSNPTTQPAVSLHLYTPPIQICHTYDESTGSARAASQCVYYSVSGKRMTPSCLQLASPPSGYSDCIGQYVMGAVSAVTSPICGVVHTAVRTGCDAVNLIQH